MANKRLKVDLPLSWSKDPVHHIQKMVEDCRKCGKEYGNNAIGFGQTNQPDYFLIGMNPWVDGNHNFKNGRGITELLHRLEQASITSFYFCNVVKCEMPTTGINPTRTHADRCMWYLTEQIRFIQPKFLILFGQSVAEWLDCSYYKFGSSRSTFIDIPSYTVPHFSSVFYGGRETIESYYSKLFKIITKP
jgi:uracil-DNA glycosylase family 4